MLCINYAVFTAVVSDAKVNAIMSPRWVRAIDRAAKELLTNPNIIPTESGALFIGSPSGRCYATDTTCQCKAHQFGQPCWHRGADRLWASYQLRLQHGLTAQDVRAAALAAINAIYA